MKKYKKSQTSQFVKLNFLMYTKTKKLLLQILPSKFLIKNEFFFRRLYSVFYLGNSVYCNVCEQHFSKFIKLSNNDKLCPLCGSLGRDRRLWKIINEDLKLHKNSRILDFSPSKSLLRKFKKQYPNYLSTDLLRNIKVDRRYDITSLPEQTNSFDHIICYHVLEHVQDDIKALKELFRVLNNNGKLLIQTPFKDGDIYENPLITSKKDRLKHFGQEDHVRIYSVVGLEKRLESVGFSVKKIEYNEKNQNKNGFNTNECVLIATKK